VTLCETAAGVSIVVPIPILQEETMPRTMLRHMLRALALTAILLPAGVAQAALTDIASMPLKTAGAKPNIMLILDDSGSMQWSYLDDSVKNKGYPTTVGYRTSLCNKLYYNPDTIYAPPIGADGLPLPNSPFDAAWLDGYQRTESSLKFDLGSQFQAWRSQNSHPDQPPSDCWNAISQCEDPGGPDNISNRPEAAYYFVYKGQRRAQLGDNSALDDCRNTTFDTGDAGPANWRKVVVGATSSPSGGDERENFANWYSYYRTRILLMKTALTRAVRDLDSSYRIGYSTIGYTGADAASTAFLPVDDFGTAQKKALYEKLAVLVRPASGTPLRGALSKAGRLFGAKVAGASDPVQYACQQNFAILSTDGYWNSNISAGVDEGPDYGPLDLDGALVGERDASLPPPLYDGTPPAGAGGSTAAAGGASNTLADVAAYYYETDLLNPRLGNCREALGLGAGHQRRPGHSPAHDYLRPGAGHQWHPGLPQRLSDRRRRRFRRHPEGDEELAAARQFRSRAGR
jgi:type IV pilus assembly protein PilY1